MRIETLWRRIGLTLLVGVAFALAAPAAVARDHHRGYQASHYGYGYQHQRPVRYAPVSRGYRHGYARPSRYRHYATPYRPAPRYYGGYGYHRHHDHWGVGEVVGALVVGTILTNVIDAAMQPRPRVVERRVVSGPYYPDDRAPTTRYVGPDDGYYDRH